MQRFTFSLRAARLAGAFAFAITTGVATTAPAQAPAGLTLWAADSIRISGSENSFCGWAHSNGSVSHTGRDNLFTGSVEYVTTLKSNDQDGINGVRTTATTMPLPPRSLEEYRALAQAGGRYFPGDAALDDADLNGLIFAEGNVRISGSGAIGTVTLISATGEIGITGSNNRLAAAMDDVLLFAAGGDSFVNGSHNEYRGAMFAPTGDFSRHGADDSLVAGPIVALTVTWSGSRSHLGAECCVADDTCDDGNACTTDACASGACVHTAIADCRACAVAADCADENVCTIEECDDGVCAWVTMPNCEACAAAADCHLGNACTQASCAAGVCAYAPIDGCRPCAAAADCADGNACTSDECDGGVCIWLPAPDCEPCATHADCDRVDLCTAGACLDGLCAYEPLADCPACESAADCADGNACTTDRCDAGVCGWTIVPRCELCATAADCAHGNACTTATCEAGVCAYQERPACRSCDTAADCPDRPCATERCAGGVCEWAHMTECRSCVSAADCGDGDVCSADTCVDGICGSESIPDCRSCVAAADCADEIACTTETCVEGRCAYAPPAACPSCAAEACDDGLDNDCDGRVDCVDADCAGSRSCSGGPEICGDCRDNDADGLVDYEDSECCARTVILGVEQLMLRPAGKRGDRIRLASQYSANMLPGFDPLTHDTSVQITDPKGVVFCTTITADHWMSRQRRHLAFWDRKGAFSGGLSDGQFILERAGSVGFRTHGKKAEIVSMDEGVVTVTVRAGETCSRATATLRARGAMLVAP